MPFWGLPRARAMPPSTRHSVWDPPQLLSRTMLGSAHAATSTAQPFGHRPLPPQPLRNMLSAMCSNTFSSSSPCTGHRAVCGAKSGAGTVPHRPALGGAAAVHGAPDALSRGFVIVVPMPTFAFETCRQQLGFRRQAWGPSLHALARTGEFRTRGRLVASSLSGATNLARWHLQVDSMFDEFSGRTVVDLGCGTVSEMLKHCPLKVLIASLPAVEGPMSQLQPPGLLCLAASHQPAPQRGKRDSRSTGQMENI